MQASPKSSDKGRFPPPFVQEIVNAKREPEPKAQTIPKGPMPDGRSFPPPLRDKVVRPLQGFRLTDIAALGIGGFGAWALALFVNAAFRGRYDLFSAVGSGFGKFGESTLIALCVLIWFAHSGHYYLRMPFWTEVRQIIETIGFAMLIDIFLRFVMKEDFSRLWLISEWLFAGAGIILFRALWRRFMDARGLWKIKTILIGTGVTARNARCALLTETGLGLDVTACIEDFDAAFRLAGHSWTRLCENYQASYVVIALEGADLLEAQSTFAQLMREDVPFSVLPPLHHLPVFGMMPHYFFNHDVLLLAHHHALNRRVPRYLKRAFDIGVAGAALLILGPLLLTIAGIIKMDGGPALFGHRRLGYQGKDFLCLKFRSMNIDSDQALQNYLANNAAARAEWQRTHKLRNDPRITAFGKFLRRTSLDELPQLLNVLKGEMSIVGPRPIIIAETQKYDSDISHYYRVRPGMTGLWQVSGRNDVSYVERVRMDSWYVRNWSLWHDIMIVCKTFPAVFRRYGAY